MILKNSILFLFITGFVTACSGVSNHGNTSNKKQEIDTFLMKFKGAEARLLPGQSMGKIRVGERSEKINNLHLGQPDKMDAGMCKSLNRWFYGQDSSQSLDIFSACSGEDQMKPHVKWVRTTDSLFKTKQGLQVGSRLQDIKSVYDSLLSVATYTGQGHALTNIITAKDRGITFEVNTVGKQLTSQDTCKAIIIHAKTEQVPRFYFSFYQNLKIKTNPTHL